MSNQHTCQLLFQEIWPLSSGFFAGESFSTDSTSMAAILLQKCSVSKDAGHYQNHAPCGQSVHTRGHVGATQGSFLHNTFSFVLHLIRCSWTILEVCTHFQKILTDLTVNQFSCLLISSEHCYFRKAIPLGPSCTRSELPFLSDFWFHSSGRSL